MRFSWMLAATVLLVLATGVRCKRKFDGDFEFAEEVSRDNVATLAVSRITSDDRMTGRSFFFSLFFFRLVRCIECPISRMIAQFRELFVSPAEGDALVAGRIDVNREAKCHTIGNDNNGDFAEGWRSVLASCCETITFRRRFAARFEDSKISSY